jgi:hypothetical protein
MPRYFFDTRDESYFLSDDEGCDFPDLGAVKTEAARALAELARDVIPGHLQRRLAVEVRDEYGPVMVAVLTFEALVLRPA